MLTKQLIEAFPKETRFINEEDNFLRVSEFYYDTIQGEGISIGCPAAFLRLQGCSLSCIWCDTTEVWEKGNPYTFTELIDMIVGSGLAGKLMDGQHLVITGGSPLRQQIRLCRFLQALAEVTGIVPFVEVENECVIFPVGTLINQVTLWNNSPKLSNSGVPTALRYKPELIQLMSLLDGSWFKFVIEKTSDWDEIESEFLNPSLIRREQIILMPCGSTRMELEEKREMVVGLAVKEGVRYCSREHIVLWNKKIGV